MMIVGNAELGWESVGNSWQDESCDDERDEERFSQYVHGGVWVLSCKRPISRGTGSNLWRKMFE
jgi:hypothetical protein